MAKLVARLLATSAFEFESRHTLSQKIKMGDIRKGVDNTLSPTKKIYKKKIYYKVLGPPCSSRDGVLGDCRPLIKCVRFLFEVETLRALPCQLPFGQPGEQTQKSPPPPESHGTELVILIQKNLRKQ